jgi:hypothetical protein
MGGIRPIGSEKLEGMDKIRRIMEIARYNENIPQSVNETRSTEYSIEFADGNTYRIEKERNGYIIKVAINESETDYIEPMKSRKYYSSYSSALKRLNLIAKEINVLHENEEGISLIGEQKKKFILKTKKKKVTEPESETPPPASEPSPAPLPPAPAPLPPAPAPDMGAPKEDTTPSGDMGITMPDDMGPSDDDMGMGPPSDDMGIPSDDEEPTDEVEDETEVEIEKKPKEKKVSDLKRIQILVGKLAQKIRSYEEEKELSPKEIKYIINSILSAIDVEVLDEDDIEQIIDKLEGNDEEDDEEDDEEVTFDEKDDEEEIAPEPPVEPEMTEGYDSLNDAFNDYFGGAFATQGSKGLRSEMGEGENGPAYRGSKGYDDASDSYTDVEEYHKERRKRHFYPEVDSFEHGTFSESSVDKVLSKYFILNESEQKNYQDGKERKTDLIYKNSKRNIIKLSESTQQMDSALNYINENPRAKILGLTNKGNLIFKEGINQVRITKSGNII